MPTCFRTRSRNVAWRVVRCHRLASDESTSRPFPRESRSHGARPAIDSPRGHVKNRVTELAKIRDARAANLTGWRQARSNLCPLGIGQITGIRQSGCRVCMAFHPFSIATHWAGREKYEKKMSTCLKIASPNSYSQLIRQHPLILC